MIDTQHDSYESFMYTEKIGVRPPLFLVIAACWPVSPLTLVLLAPSATVARKVRSRFKVSLLTTTALAHLLLRCLDTRLFFCLGPSLLLKSLPSLHALLEPLLLCLDVLLRDNLFHDRFSLARAFEKVCLMRTILLGVVGVHVAPESTDGETVRPCLVNLRRRLGTRSRHHICV